MTFFFHYLTIRKRRRRCRNRKLQHGTKNSTSASTCVDHLPTHILIDILSRLPLNTLLISRCVSKTWNLLISDPLFATSSSSSNPQLFLRISKTLHWVDINSISATPAPATSHTNLRFHLPQLCSDYVIVNSCNGFLCLSKSVFQNPSIICNPVTGQYITIPQPQHDPDLSGNVVSGFGYSFKTNQYKVLRVVLNKWCLSMAELYTLGVDSSWRKLGYAPLAPVGGFFATYLNGVIHWACDDMDACHFIVGFDFEDECFRVVPAPEHFDAKLKKKESLFCMNMCVLGGCLSICECDVHWSTRHFDIWVMKEYGVQQSWTKQFVIENCGFCRPIKVVADGDALVLFCKRKGLVLYDAVGKNVRCLEICDPHSITFQAVSFVPTFASLRDAVGVDGTKVQNGRSRFDERELHEEDETLVLMERSRREVLLEQFYFW